MKNRLGLDFNVANTRKFPTPFLIQARNRRKDVLVEELLALAVELTKEAISPSRCV